MSVGKENVFSFIKNIHEKGFFYLLTSNILLRVIGFGSQLLVIKLLSPTELGQIKTLQIYTELAALIAAFGFNTATLKLCSDNISLEERSDILKKNISYSLLMTLIVMSILFYLSKQGVISPDSKINLLLPYFMLSMPAAIVLGQFSSYLQAIKQVKVIAITQVIYRLCAIAIVIGATRFYGIYGFIGATVISAYIYLPFIFQYVKRFISSRINENSNLKELFKANLYYAKWSFFALLGHKLTQYADILLLNYLIVDREGFGLYSIATLFLIPIREVNNSVRTISLPYLNEKKNNKKEFLRVLKKYQRLMLIQAVGICLFAWFIVPFIVDYFFGPEYDLTTKFFRILLIGYLFQSYMALMPTALISLGMMKYNFFSTVLYFPAVFAINYFLIIKYGLTGAAIAQVISSVIILLVIIFVTKYALNQFYKEHALY